MPPSAQVLKLVLPQPSARNVAAALQVIVAYCNKKGMDTSAVRFLFDGSRVNPSATPGVFGVGGGKDARHVRELFNVRLQALHRCTTPLTLQGEPPKRSVSGPHAQRAIGDTCSVSSAVALHHSSH